MGRTPKRILPLALGLALIVVAATSGVAGPSPEHCTRCYEKLQQDNRDCQKLEGQDWSICREAAAMAYRECSKGC